MNQHHIHEMAKAIAKHLQTEHGLPVDPAAIVGPLMEYWDAFAVHVWSVGDVFDQARRNGWPMCDADAREILSDIEANIDSEHGITWQTISDAVDFWCEGIRWAELGEGLMRAFRGHFIIEAQGCYKRVNGTLLRAVEVAYAAADELNAAVNVISIDEQAEKGHRLLTVQPEGENSEVKDEHNDNH